MYEIKTSPITTIQGGHRESNISLVTRVAKGSATTA